MPIFKDIYQKLISKTLLKTTTENIFKFSVPTGDFESNVNSILKGLLSSFSQSNAKDMENYSAELFLPNSDIDRLLRGFKDYEAESNDTYKNRDPTLKKKRATELYKDAYEMYSKVIRNIYWRATGADRKSVEEGRRNGEIRTYFSENYPKIYESLNNALRKDAAHLNYDERDKYNAEEILESANKVLTTLITAIIAQLQVYKELFEDAASASDSDLDKFYKIKP